MTRNLCVSANQALECLFIDFTVVNSTGSIVMISVCHKPILPQFVIGYLPAPSLNSTYIGNSMIYNLRKKIYIYENLKK